jgi:hypothetical protein
MREINCKLNTHEAKISSLQRKVDQLTENPTREIAGKLTGDQNVS